MREHKGDAWSARRGEGKAVEETRESPGRPKTLRGVHFQAHFKGSAGASRCRSEGRPPRSRRPLVAACGTYSCPLGPASLRQAGELMPLHPVSKGPLASFQRGLETAQRGRQTWVIQDWNLGPWMGGAVDAASNLW